MNRLLTLVALSALVAPMAEAAQSGNVRGRVLDDAGLAVPGTDVVLTSAELPLKAAEPATDESSSSSTPRRTLRLRSLRRSAVGPPTPSRSLPTSPLPR